MFRKPATSNNLLIRHWNEHVRSYLYVLFKLYIRGIIAYAEQAIAVFLYSYFITFIYLSFFFWGGGVTFEHKTHFISVEM